MGNIFFLVFIGVKIILCGKYHSLTWDLKNSVNCDWSSWRPLISVNLNLDSNSLRSYLRLTNNTSDWRHETCLIYVTLLKIKNIHFQLPSVMFFLPPWWWLKGKPLWIEKEPKKRQMIQLLTFPLHLSPVRKIERKE